MGTCLINSPTGGSYLPLEYIESSGTQAINTGVKPSEHINRLIIEVDGRIVDATKVAYFASSYYIANNTASRLFLGLEFDQNTNRFSLVTGNSGFTKGGDTNRHIFKINQINGQHIIDNEVIGTRASVMSLNVNQSIPLFAVARNFQSGGNDMFYGSSIIYGCKIYDNDTLLRDFVPCIRNSDKTIGLLDKVNNQFYGNSGTGQFIAGPPILKRKRLIMAH